MSLEKIILTEGKLEILTQKLGYGEKTARTFIELFGKSLAVPFAKHFSKTSPTLFNTLVKTELKDEVDSSEIATLFKTSHQNYSILKLNLTNSTFPKPTKNEWKLFIDGRLKVDNLNEMYSSIYDWLNGVVPRPDIRGMSVFEAYAQSEQWHQELAKGATGKLSGKITDVAPNAEIIHTFEDGAYWVDMHENECGQLGDIMGHCASTQDDTLLQLFLADGHGAVTVAFNYPDEYGGGSYSQMKGTGNSKPTKYEKYILWLFTNEGEYQLEYYNGTYKTHLDFTVEDISDEKLKEQILEKHPDLDSDIGKFNRIVSKEGLTDKQKWNALKKENLHTEMNLPDFDEEREVFEIFSSEDNNGYEDIFNDGDGSFAWVYKLLTDETSDEMYDWFNEIEVDPEYYFNHIDFKKFDIKSPQVKSLLKVMAQDDDIAQLRQLVKDKKFKLKTPEGLKQLLTEAYNYEDDDFEFESYKQVIDRCFESTLRTITINEMSKDLKKYLDYVVITHEENSAWNFIIERKDYLDYTVYITMDTLAEIVREHSDETIVDFIPEGLKVDKVFYTPHYGYPSLHYQTEEINENFEYIRDYIW